MSFFKNSNGELPIFPPRKESSIISWMRVQVVPLPLVPVTAIIGQGHSSKKILVTLVTSLWAFMACWISGVFIGMPGERMIKSKFVRLSRYFGPRQY